jgi:hypothetical protein
MHYDSMAFSTDKSDDAPRVLQAVDIVNGNRVPNQANTNRMGQRNGLSITDAIELVSDSWTQASHTWGCVSAG